MTYLPIKPAPTGSLSIPVTNTYAASGAIRPADSFAIVNAAVAATMTLAAGTVDGHEIVIKRLGVGAVTVACTVDATAQTLTMSSAALQESLTLRWSASLASYLLIDVLAIPGTITYTAPVGLTMTQPPAWRIHQRATLTGSTNGKGAGSIPLTVNLSFPAAILEYRLRDATTAATLQNWAPCSLNAPGGTSTVTCTGVPAYLGWYLIDLRANQDNKQVVLGTNKVGVGRLIGCGGQSEIVRIFGRMDGETATNASLGIAISPYSSCYGSYTDIIRTVSAAVWAPPADGGSYDSSACSELLRLQVAASGVPCAVVGYGNGGTQIASWLPGNVNWNTLQNNLSAVGSAYEAFIWCQGASDNTTTAETVYRTRLAQFYTALDAANGLGSNVVHIDSHMQSITNPNFGNYGQILGLRRSHQIYAQQHPGTTVYVPLSDADTCAAGGEMGLEVSMSGYVVCARHWHRAMRPKLGLTGVGDAGPTMGKPTISGAVITIPVIQAGGTTLSAIGSWWTKWMVFAAGSTSTLLTVSSGTVSATAITLTLSAAPAGDVDVYFDVNPTTVTTNSALMVYDNNASDGDGITLGRPLMHNGTALSTATLAAATAITFTGATYDTATPKFGTAALSGGTGTLPYSALPPIQPFTVECWGKASVPGSAIQALFGSAYGWIGVATDGTVTGTAGGSGPINTSVLVADGNWHHFAITVANNNCTIWVDGSAAGGGSTGTWAVPTTGAFGIRQFDTQGAATVFAGEIDEMIVSAIEKYVGPFVLAATPAIGTEYGAYSVYHLNSDGTGTATPYVPPPPPMPTAITLALPTYDTISPKFGTAALNGGTGTIPFANLPQALPITLECWGKTAAAGTAIQALFGSGLYGWVGVNTDGTVTGQAGTAPPLTSTIQVADGAWHHFALVVTSGNLTVYVDGVSAATAATTGWAVSSGVPFGVRQFESSGGATTFGGEIDEMIVSTIAKYTGTFTPATAAATGSEAGTFVVYHLDSNGTGVA